MTEIKNIPVNAVTNEEAAFQLSEIFKSIQGEGHYTGVPTLWLRWFICNLECRGFGQLDPADRSTYQKTGNDMDLSGTKDIHELPVFPYGCDSAYSVSKKYKHLIPKYTAKEIVNNLRELMRSNINPDGLFQHPHSQQEQHLCMTGGEPMLKRTQKGIIAVMSELERQNCLPRFITIETNGTQPLTEDLQMTISSYVNTGGEWFWSVSPKLLHTSGEPAERAIKPEIVAQYARTSPTGQLKFVVSGTKASWDELEERVHDFRMAGVMWPVWIMPIGSTEEAQRDDRTREIVAETIRRGYNVSARVHCYLWGNTVGV